MSKRFVSNLALVCILVFAFTFGIASTVGADQSGRCCHEMCPGSQTDTSFKGTLIDGECEPVPSAGCSAFTWLC